MLGCNNSVYELDITASSAALPTANYTHPVTQVGFTAIGESPSGILVALLAGRSPSILELTLDSTGGVPTLIGATTVAQLPPGETIHAVQSYLASFLAVGTNAGLRVGTFDTYSGSLTLGPLTLTTSNPVLSVAGRDRFLFAGYTNGQPDGTTGLVRIDLSLDTDDANRKAWAPDLKPPTTAVTGKGAVVAVRLLPSSGRLVWISDDGLHIEGSGPGSSGEAWIETSRIRYGTAVSKLFTRGSVQGVLKVDEVKVEALMPYDQTASLGTIGYSARNSEFALPDTPIPWLQLKFYLLGSDTIVNSYQVKAIPAPARQHLIGLTANCYVNEEDRWGVSVSDPESPRVRLQNVENIESSGTVVPFIEFTIDGPVSSRVVIDQLMFQQDTPPKESDDFGGLISFILREV